jgi:hypothetical protein
MTLALRALLLLGVVGFRGVVLPGAPADSLGVQRCNTRCQTTFTDCVDRCDGAAPCEADCTRTVGECVKTCTNPPPGPSGPPRAPVVGTKPGKRPAGKAAPKQPAKPGAG